MYRKVKKPLYYVWKEMKQRCSYPKDISYKYYGARGIKVSSRWLNFLNFQQDMLPTYKKGLTLDRIDNSKDYSKENCRWATPQEQANNRRSNKLIKYDGLIKTQEEWIRALNLKGSTVRQRLYVLGWDIDRAFEHKHL